MVRSEGADVMLPALIQDMTSWLFQALVVSGQDLWVVAADKDWALLGRVLAALMLAYSSPSISDHILRGGKNPGWCLYTQTGRPCQPLTLTPMHVMHGQDPWVVVADRESAPSGRALAALVQALARLGYVAVLRFVAKDHSVLHNGLQTRTLAVMSSAFSGEREALARN